MWCVHLLKYNNHHSAARRGKKKQSQQFDSQREAEAQIFATRYNLETKASRTLVDAQLLGTEAETADPRPQKRRRVSNDPVDTRAKSMSQNPAIRNAVAAPVDTNPKVPGAFNRYNDDTSKFLDGCANMIKFNWSAKQRRRAEARMLKILRDQAERTRLIDSLRQKIAAKNWQELLEGGINSEVQWSASSHDRERVLEQAKAICRALEIAYHLAVQNVPFEWVKDCCCPASQQLGIATGQMVARWNREFHQGNDSNGVVVVERFPWSLRGRIKTTGVRSPLDPEQGGDEELALRFKAWAKENLEELSVEVAFAWLEDELHTWTAGHCDALNIELPLKPHVVSSWMRDAGFVYSQYKKCYAVNTHERPDVIEARRHYVFSYLQREINQAVWVQLPIDKARECFSQDEEFESNLYWIHRHEYTKEEDGTAMVELPVFAFSHQQMEAFLEGAEAIWQRLGGFPSVRKHPNKKVEIWFGQDESTFSSHSMNEKCWKIDGECPFRNKGEGKGLMASAFNSFAFGFGMSLTEQELEQVNAQRLGETYKDADAARELLGTATKAPLTESPFLVLFDYGKAKSGYWGYKHIICQLEDCVDVLRVLFPGDNGDKFAYDFVFEFDWSAGHSRNRPDGLTVGGSTNLGFGGVQPIMRDTTITDADTELGPCVERILQVGDVQSMVFKEGDAPPIVAPSAPPHDVTKGPPQIKEKSGRELKDELKSLGMHELTNGLVAEVKTKAANAGLSLFKNVAPTTDGYIGKAKGLKQIAWERGFWSKAELLQKGLVKEDVIRSRLATCHDFATKISQMQFIAQELGVEVVMTPKAHPELAGQGVEYSWGYSKFTFRRNNTGRTSKEKVQQLEANIRAALSTESSLNIERVRKFVRKARDYKVIYREHFKTLDSMVVLATECGNEEEQAERRSEIASFRKHHYAKIERQVKDVKAHRAAIDIDTKFIKES